MLAGLSRSALPSPPRPRCSAAAAPEGHDTIRLCPPGSGTSPRRVQHDRLQHCARTQYPEAGCGTAGITVPVARSSPPHYLFTKTIRSNGEHTCLRLQLKQMRPYIANCLCVIANLRICMKAKYLWSISKWQRFYRLCNTKTHFLKMCYIKPQLPGRK